MSARGRLIAALGVAATLFLAGCSQRTSKLPSAPSTPVEPVPVADSPRHALELFQWTLMHRDSTRYESLFTADYRFVFSATDSAGTPYRFTPWTRDDEVISSRNLCSDAASIELIFDGDLTPRTDDRGDTVFTYPWHQMIVANRLTLTITKNDGSAWRITGGAKFYFVSGDSAWLTSGQPHDPKRWYMQGWVDMTGLGGFRVAEARTNPTRVITWGSIKAYYRNPDSFRFP